ncbi:Tol [Fusarium tjaetaba]|uniref:Tol n=1 Tax=Fusarium tjaetaba TaxID=1567544 RepID=A0A8H5QG19_9HYPO|nr:Tol [Fusarium tjaetaba]KAF5614099.1 Tol [Fusarium tjaetaba]
MSKYKYLAHVRDTATDRIAVACNIEENDNDQTFLSVIISPRTSSIGAGVPITIIVNLMSLTMNPRLTLPLPPSQRVAVLSLHSWTYNFLPSRNLTGLFDVLVNLGSKLTVLQPGALPEEKTPTPREQESDPEDERIQTPNARRETDGYTIIRRRTVTASIARGPFTPTLVPHQLREGLAQSNFSTDLQTLDPRKILAMGETTFSAALARLHNSIHGQALTAAKRGVYSGLGGFQSRAEAAAGILNLIQGFSRSSESHHILSTPSKRSAFPPPLPCKSKPVQVPRCVALSRSRPPCPRLQAQLVTQHAESLQKIRASERARKPAPPKQIIIADERYFEFNIYPYRQHEFVPSNTKLPVDLIFSLRQPDPKYFNTPLINLVIVISFGAIQKKKPLAKSTEHMIPDKTNKTKTDDPPPPFTPLLGPNPDPPMPTMLSNMRFNIIKHFGIKKEGFENHLILEVIPRAAAGVDVSLVRDASFLMGGVEIACITSLMRRRH